MSLIISFRSEVLKTKRTAAFYFTLIGAAIVPLMLLITIASDGLPNEPTSSKDPINFIFRLSYEIKLRPFAYFPCSLYLSVPFCHR